MTKIIYPKDKPDDTHQNIGKIASSYKITSSPGGH